MIIITHKIDRRGNPYVTAKTDQGRFYHQPSYLTGWDKPNYPMPAIPITVDVWSDTVGIFAWNKDIECGDIVAAFVKR